ncbi:hypothetical protein [Tepidiforma sp.]|uniref:hypothetical protein n=1 Tax=Tepidiforma sp. TaxID=2682230 RepID=UPI002ADD6BF8|nr:hypothetical protein [Tepidiforma sp.]
MGRGEERRLPAWLSGLQLAVGVAGVAGGLWAERWLLVAVAAVLAVLALWQLRR